MYKICQDCGNKNIEIGIDEYDILTEGTPFLYCDDCGWSVSLPDRPKMTYKELYDECEDSPACECCGYE